MLDRRQFVASFATGALTLSLAWPDRAAAGDGEPSTLTESNFRTPPPSAKPHSWWHWINGNVTADGITRDLEAMARVGVGGVHMFDVGVGLPEGPAKMLSPLWLKLVRHAAVECDRLGLSFTLHNCPGFSSSGGPWIKPEQAMQQLVWSETNVPGAQPADVVLPQPLTRLGHYRDAMTIAVPAPASDGGSLQGQIVRARAGGRLIEHRLVTDGDAATGVDLTAGEAGALTLEFARSYVARSITVQAIPDGDFPPFDPRALARLEVSDDGSIYRHAADLAIPFWRLHTIPPLTAGFGAISARYWRLTLPAPLHVAEIRLSAAPNTEALGAKAGWGRITNMEESPGDVPAADAIPPDKVIDVTRFVDNDGRLRWTPPPGAWTILRFGHTPTGATNVAASDSGVGLECDKFSRAALDFHFETYFSQVRQVLTKLGTRGLAGALVDSYEPGMQNWTAGLPAEFAKRRGYSLTSYMPALTGRVVGSAEVTERFLWDFRRVLAMLMEDHYYGRFHELCQRDGLISYTEPYGNGPFDDMQAGARMDRLMGEFWVRGGAAAFSVKLAASVAHVYGKRFVGAESFTGRAAQSRWLEHPYAMKALGDEMYTLGLNHFVFHRYAQQPHPTARPGMTMGPWGFHFDRTNTWFEQAGPWLDYAARCQHLLKCGNFVADILYFIGENSPAHVPVHVEEPLAVTLSGARPSLSMPVPEGHDYDVCDAAVLLHRARIADGRIVLPDGMSYRVLVMPDGQRITRELLARLRDMVRQGMWLVGAPPRHSHGLAGYPESDADVRAIAREMWDDLNGGTRTERAFGRGRVIWGRSLREVLDAANTPPDVDLDAAPDAAIRWIHRRDGETDIYFIANTRRRAEDLVCTFRIAGRRPELWNAETGEIMATPAFERADDGRTRVALRLDTAESVFVMFRPNSGAGLTSVAKEGARQLVTQLAPALPVEALADSFTLAGWVKPETDLWIISPEIASADRSLAIAAARDGALARGATIERLGLVATSMLLDPPAGDTLFGPGSAAPALSVGRNGLVLYEHVSEGYPAVLAVPAPIAGWTHLALVYDRGTPTLYLDGKALGTGTRSPWRVTATLGNSVAQPRHFEGDVAELTLSAGAASARAITAMAANALPPPAAPPAFEYVRAGLLFWENGRYDVGARSIEVSRIDAPITLERSWHVRFPADLGAPARISLRTLQSLHRHSDAGVRHFAGTATYGTRFVLPSMEFGGEKRLYLDLGRVEVIAAIRVNGKPLGTLWKPPFRLDITDAVRAGDNLLEIAVTNLWPNRLIGDEQLPPENVFHAAGGIKALPDWYRAGHSKPPGGRVTFTTWKHFAEDSPLLESGLLGPVMLRHALRYPLTGTNLRFREV